MKVKDFIEALSIIEFETEIKTLLGNETVEKGFKTFTFNDFGIDCYGRNPGDIIIIKGENFKISIKKLNILYEKHSDILEMEISKLVPPKLHLYQIWNRSFNPLGHTYYGNSSSLTIYVK